VRQVEDEIHPPDSLAHAVNVAHVTYVELELVVAVRLPHVVLFFLIPGEDADLADVCVQEVLQYSVPERASASGNQKCLVLEQLVSLFAGGYGNEHGCNR
jgi:hypothetical protein